jgi:hypothetical protein
MALRYTSAPAIPTDFRQVAESVLGPVDWIDEHSGYCACPGAHRHTTPSRERDCRVYLDADNGHAPTVHCFHDSCQEEVAAANFALRSTLGKVAFRAGDHHEFVRRQNGFDSGTDPFETFLKACFEADDILSLAPGTLPDGETRPIPEHGGGWSGQQPRAASNGCSPPGTVSTSASTRSLKNPTARIKM